MKHLKKFNESKLGDELEEFCKEYLAYLTDGKFECYINSNNINIYNKGFSIGLVLDGGIPEYATCMGVTL